jgi:aminopeptidase N
VSLTLLEARERAGLVHDVSYDLHLDLTSAPEEGADTFGVTARIIFGCRQPGASTFLELHAAQQVLLDGLPATTYDGRRIALEDLAEHNEVTVEALVPYVTDGDGMHTFTDPVDGETYVSAYVGMDIAQKVFPCFDQNDLKAPIALRVTAPEGWTVLANGKLAEEAAGHWSFETTQPIPVAMFVVCAGPWASYTWEHAGTDFGWHARRSMTAQLERDGDELRRITDACWDHYARIFDEPYGFGGDYQQVLAPGQNWGAVETPGCVTYRDEYLPPGPPTDTEARARAMVIAHEMSHMWFGDLVTMTWWEDTWLQESFADYMGFRVAEEAAGYAGTFVDQTISWRPEAYLADERRSTHPVAPRAEDVPDVDSASSNFDSLSYAKGGSVLRQLGTWLGDETFFAGVNRYLSTHAWGNTVFSDFVDALDAVTDRDVHAWVEAWVRTSGFDTLTVTRDAHGPVLTRTGIRPHRIRVSSYDAGLALRGSWFVDVADEPVRLEPGEVVVPNAEGETFARLRFDEQSWAAVARDLASIAEPGARAVCWSTAFDLVQCRELDPEEFLGLVTRHLPRETEPGIAQGVLRWTDHHVVRAFLPPARAADGLAQVAAACESGLASGPRPEVAQILLRGLAATTPDVELLQRWLTNHETHTGAEVDPTLRWLAVVRLAALGALEPGEIEDERISDGTAVGGLGAARALAARPDVDAKAQAWERLATDTQISNRVFEATAAGFWQPEQATLVHPYVQPYLDAAPGIARSRGQAFSALVGRAFPDVPLLRVHVDALQTALAGDVPTVLRRDWDDKLDDLRRVHP